MSSQEPALRVQINQIDHTLVPPGPLDNSSLPRVPVLRIYGASSTGQKACVHVHQVYPYFFVEYNGKLNPDSVNRYIARLTLSLDHAIALSMKRNPHSPNSKFVRAILLVKGVHFYGFHSSYSPFLKIVIIDPAFVTRAVTVLQFGNVMRTRFNVYESHLGYILQFMCDFGLYGCGWIDLGEVWQRRQDEGEQEFDPGENSKTFQEFNLSPHFRQTRMPLEVDAAAHQILNRHQLVARDLHHKLTIPALPLPSDPLVISVRELWEDERRRRLARGLSPSPEIPVDPSESSRGTGGEWVAEARWWDEIRKRIEKEKEGDVEVVASGNGWEKEVMTTFESVQALWEKGRKRRQRQPREPSQVQVSQPNDAGGGDDGYEESHDIWNLPNSEVQDIDVDVDEIMLSSQEMSHMVETEEEEWANLLGENPLFENEDGQRDGDEGYFDDEDDLLSEDGPSPNLRAENDSVRLSRRSDQASTNNIDDPFSNAYEQPPGKRVNLFQEDLTIHKRHHASFNESITPDKSQINEPSAKHLTMTPSKIKQPATLVPTLPVSHILEEYAQHHREVTEAAQDSLRLQDEAARQRSPNDRALFGMTDPDSSNPTNGLPTKTGDVQCSSNESTRNGTTSNSIDNATRAEHPAADLNKEGKYPSNHTINWEDGQSAPPLNASPKLPSDPSSMVTSKYMSSVVLTAVHSSSSFPKSIAANPNAYIYAISPPSISELIGSLDEFTIPNKIYRDAYYSDEIDAPDNPREYAGLLYHLNGGVGLSTLDEWGGGQSVDMSNANPRSKGKAKAITQCDHTPSGGWEYASCPPSHREVKKWLTSDAGRRLLKKSEIPSQIEGPTQTNPYGLKNIVAAAASDSIRERQDMNSLSLEIFAPNRGSLVPDPGVDEIAAAFWSFRSPNDARGNLVCQTGIIVLQNEQLHPSRLRDFLVEVVDTELELLNKIVDIVMDLDPDIITGWEIQAASWGYLNSRGRQYGFEISELISRAPSRHLGGGGDQWGMTKTSNFATNGRHVLNLWRIMRSDLTLSMYSFENVVFHVLGKRVPRYNDSTLTEWYMSSVASHTARVLRYMADRTLMLLEILEEAEVVTKTAEFARVFGVDFMSVIRRGSQFKVESFMFRIGKPESLVFLSPSRQAVGKQNAAECMPLIMEPLSAFYNSPLVVLDFQSLYPSVMIAYNYCYSTCLGRITDFKGRNKLGVTELHHPRGMLDTLQGHINVAPNGIMYVKPEVRKGLLGRMLTELLETRIMVKHAMKGVKEDKLLRKILDARQLGLKYIANVTYGYTSATFSGRMPAVEIADSIVQSGRETLEKAVCVIHSTKKWGAKVVYGDTDSLFIHLKGKTKEQAFRIGHDIADAITSLNPAPVKLKFEKVYIPCVLMAKKRYVGFKYENPDDQEPVFDAKGIETVRRDGIPAQQKMTENCLKILFRTQDLSQVKAYCCKSWKKILENRVSVQDFIFAKEVKMGTYSDKGPPPPGVAIAARRLIEDPNDEIQYGDRTPYVIIRGEPNSRLVDRAIEPLEVLDNYRMHLDAAYYISRVLIPPLERIFNLVGANVRAWYDEMPKTIKADWTDQITFSPKKIRKDVSVNRFKIDEHFQSSQCLVCGDLTPTGICDSCHVKPQTTIPELLRRISKGEKRLMNTQRICESCTNSAPSEPIRCESVDCAWLFERKKAERKAETLGVLRELMDSIEPAGIP